MRTIALVILLMLAGCATTSTTVPKEKMAEGYYMKGLAHLQQKNYELALVEFQRSIQTDSKNKKAYYALGLVNYMQDKLAEAEEFYKEAIDIDSQFSEAHNALGNVYAKQKRWEKAIKSYKKALKNTLYTTPHLPHLNIGSVYMAKKEYGKAAEAYRDSKRYANLEWTVYYLGMALLEGGKTKAALKEFQEGVELAPKNAFMRYGLALALLKGGRKKEAAASFEKAAKLAPPKSDIARKANDYIRTLR